MKRLSCGIVGVTSVALLVALVCVAVGDSAGAQNAPAKPTAAAESTPRTGVVERADLLLHMDREGRIDSARRVKVRLIPETYNGPFEIVDVLKRGGRVSKGDTIMQLDGEALSKEIDNALIGLDHARRRLELAREEDRILKEANATRLEQTEKAKTRTATELTIWEKFDGPDMLKQAELSLRQREYYLADERQELEQLEKMYQGTHLATETKDIVLERARRQLKVSEAWLELAKHDDVITRETRYPQQDQSVRDTARWSAQDDAHARVNVRASEERKSMELQLAERAVRDAEEKLAKLQSDAKLLIVMAPADGIMTRIELEPRDQISARQTICEVLDPDDFIVKINATAEDLRVLKGGADSANPATPIELTLPEYPEAEIQGVVQEMADIGTASDQATNFPMVLAIKAGSPLVRIGLRCKAHASRTLKDVLTIPAEAVKDDHGRKYCTVRTERGPEKREITVGPTSDKKTAVMSGVRLGEEVVIDEAGAK
jgi:multidrug resistance efflux pump